MTIHQSKSNFSAYFVSDIHLGSKDEPRFSLFLDFLKSLKVTREISHLFLVGDIFDLWIADHQYFVDKYSEIIEEIKRLNSEGVEIHYFEGNHDLYLKHFWSKKVGVHIHEGPGVFQLGRLRVRVEHGDQMDPEDRGYIFLRWLLRTPLMKLIALHLPQKLVVKIGEKASEHSRVYTSETKTISTEKNIQNIRVHAQKVRQQEEFDYIISGHVHVKDDFCFQQDQKNIKSVNLGTWLEEPCVYFLNDEQGNFISLA